jgi:hypothetical protein
MKQLSIVLLLLALLTGCVSSVNQSDQNTVQDPTSDNDPGNQVDTGAPDQSVEQSTSTSRPDCYGPDIHPVGKSIADQFEDQTDYDQVMVWFCNGIQFDDILAALQTEVITGISADDLLEMLSGGLTWDQIWVEIGLTEE